MRRFRGHYVNVVVNVDVTPFLRAVQAAAADAARSLDTMAQAVRNMGRVMARAHEVQVSGLEARLYVRAGLDPAYAEPDALDRLVRRIIRKPHLVVGLGDSMFLTHKDRFRLAAAAMAGWAAHRPREWRHPEVTYEEPLPWFRYMAGQRVQVWPDRVLIS